jgi:hypothetical protein
LEIKHRCCSVAPGFAAPGGEQHEGCCSEPIP